MGTPAPAEYSFTRIKCKTWIYPVESKSTPTQASRDLLQLYVTVVCFISRSSALFFIAIRTVTSLVNALILTQIPFDIPLLHNGKGRIESHFMTTTIVSCLTQCNFQKKSIAVLSRTRILAEPSYRIASNDVFPEEFMTFIFAGNRVRKVFLKHHQCWLDTDF